MLLTKASLIVIHPFTYDSSTLSTLTPCEFIAQEERDDFLPYVRNFIEKDASNQEPKAFCIAGRQISLVNRGRKKLKPADIHTVSMRDGKVYFFKEGIGLLTLRFDLGKTDEEQYALIKRALTGLSKVNSFQISAQVISIHDDQEIEAVSISSTGLSDWLKDFIQQYIGIAGDFNPFMRSNATGYSVLLADSDYRAAPAFIEALLHNRKYSNKDVAERKLADSINYIRQSEHIETYGNTNGVVYLCRDDGTEFSRSGLFDVYCKQYLVTYLIAVYQQVKLQQYLTDASNLIVTDHPTKEVKGLKEKILTYIARTDFTQISNNPARNTLYKFFRRNFEIKELLEEVSTIIKKIDQEIESEHARLHAVKAQKAEKIAMILEVLILPYYLHHIIELILKHFLHDELIVHEWSFWGTIASTIIIIGGIQVLLRSFRK